VVAKAGEEDERVHISFPPKTAAPGSTTAPGAKGSKAPVARREAPMVLTPRPSTAPAAASTPAPAAATQSQHP
jgi:hypothetical protein